LYVEGLFDDEGRGKVGERKSKEKRNGGQKWSRGNLLLKKK